jgi:hypothetical protein
LKKVVLLNSIVKNHLTLTVTVCFFKTSQIAGSSEPSTHTEMGIHNDLLKLCEQQITIPRLGHAESLNAAVASGIIISQIVGRL